MLEGLRNRVSWWMTAWLVVIWMLVNHTWSLLHVTGGLALAVAVQFLFPLPRTGTRWRPRGGAIVALIWHFLTDLVRAGLQVTWIVLRGRRVTNAVISVDLYSNDPVHLTLVSAMTSLVPGSIVVRIDRGVGVLDLHILDIDGQGGPEEVRANVLALERRVFAASGIDCPDEVCSRRFGRSERLGTRAGGSPEPGEQRVFVSPARPDRPVITRRTKVWGGARGTTSGGWGRIVGGAKGRKSGGRSTR